MSTCRSSNIAPGETASHTRGEDPRPSWHPGRRSAEGHQATRNVEVVTDKCLSPGRTQPEPFMAEDAGAVGVCELHDDEIDAVRGLLCTLTVQALQSHRRPSV